MQYRKRMTDCESGKACNMALAAPSSNSQGSQFLSMHTEQHGGKKTRRSYRMRGGSVAELASYPTSFEPSILPADLHGTAGVASLDKAIADLSQFRQAGGARKTRRFRGGALGYGPVNSGGPLISADMEKLTFQNPQWYDENLVNPNFQGPSVAKVGGKRKSHRKSFRKNYRKSRKASRKHRKNMTGGKRHSKASRKSNRKTSRK